MAARGSGRGGYGVEELRRDLRQKAPAPVYVIEGEEALLAAEAAQIVLDAALPAAGRDFNYGVFSGDDETGRQFLAQARSFPSLADRRVVLVRRFEKLALRDRDETAFLEYLRRPVPTTVLILVASKLDRRTSLAKELDRRARVVKVDTLDDSELPGWVKRRFESRQAQPTEAACRLLVELAGPGLLDLGNEIDKILARYPEARRIEPTHVESTVGRHRAEEVFALNRAFRPGNLSGFMQVFGRVLATEDEMVRLLALLQRHVNDLLRIRTLLDRGMTGWGPIAERLKKNPYAVQQSMDQAKAFSRAELLLWLRNLQRADVQLKSVKLPPRWVLERALLNSFLGQDLV